MTRKRIIRDGSAPARRSTTVPTTAPPATPRHEYVAGTYSPPLAPRAAHDYGLCGGVCPDCTAPAPAPRLRTYSDEVSELRGALIAMLWNVVGGDTDESCGGDCEARGDHGDGTPFPACAAVRALGWGEHFSARSFEMRASR